MIRVDDPRTENMILAALRFWMEVAEHSQTHPSRHPSVTGQFVAYSPLTVKEIEAFIDTRTVERVEYTTLSTVAKELGTTRLEVWQVVKRLGLEPIIKDRNVGLFKQSDMDIVREALQK